MSKLTDWLEEVKKQEGPCDSKGPRCEIDYVPTPDSELKMCSPTCPISVLRRNVKALVKVVELLREALHKWIASNHPAPFEATNYLPDLESLVPEEEE